MADRSRLARLLSAGILSIVLLGTLFVLVPARAAPTPDGGGAAIQIHKRPDLQQVERGQTVTFTVGVTNSGGVPLLGVTVSDPLVPDCARALGELAAGESRLYDCTLAAAQDDLTSTATVSATYVVGAVGITDLLFANYAEPNRRCLGLRVGGFGCADLGPEANASMDVQLGDVNGDGALDAVFANGFNSDQRNRLCLGDGVGGFTCSDLGPDLQQSYGIALGHVNGDAHLDAVIANERPLQRNRICLGDGAGGFTCSDVSANQNNSFGVALGDINGDSAADVLFANFYSQPNLACLGDGTGGFAPCTPVSSDPYDSTAVALGDVNGDLLLDAIFASSGQPNQRCLGNGSGGFACADISPATLASKSVVLADVNGDLFLDALFANFDEPNTLCLGNGSGGFACSAISPDANYSRAVAVGRVDTDPHLDAVFANVGEPNRLCLGDGAGGFACSDVNADRNFTQGVALGDIGGPSINSVSASDVAVVDVDPDAYMTYLPMFPMRPRPPLSDPLP